MKVLMISKALVSGAYHKKIDELVQLGVDMSVVVPPVWGTQTCEIERPSGYVIYKLPVFFNGHNHFHAYRGLSRVFDDVKPDIVHIDEEHYSYVTYQAMRIAVEKNVRALFFTWQNINKKYPFPFSYFEQYNFNHADVAIAGNNDAKEILFKKGFSGDISVIPQFGVDPSLFLKKDQRELRRRMGIDLKSFVLGFVGRIVEEKGLINLVEALAHLDSKCHLLIAGSGDFKGSLVVAARRLGVENRISFVPSVKSTDVPDVINCCDCIVLPSLTKSNWKEQFGRILIEAMSCEVPVIGSNSGEIPGVIGEGGLVFREGNCVELANNISRLFHDSELRARLAVSGRNRVLKLFSQRKIAEATFDVYKSML